MANALLHPLRGLLIAQFFGAFNDNAWKLMVALLAIRQATANIAPGPEREAATQTQTTLTFVIFTLPLVLLSLVGGTSETSRWWSLPPRFAALGLDAFA